MDALGRSARRDLLEEFVQLQLLPYEKFFSVGKKHASLDQVRMQNDNQNGLKYSFLAVGFKDRLHMLLLHISFAISEGNTDKSPDY